MCTLYRTGNAKPKPEPNMEFNVQPTARSTVPVALLASSMFFMLFKFLSCSQPDLLSRSAYRQVSFHVRLTVRFALNVQLTAGIHIHVKLTAKIASCPTVRQIVLPCLAHRQIEHSGPAHRPMCCQCPAIDVQHRTTSSAWTPFTISIFMERPTPREDSRTSCLKRRESVTADRKRNSPRTNLKEDPQRLPCTS